MKVTESDNSKHRQLQIEDYLQRVSAEQKEYAEACASPKMTETDSTDANKQTEGLLEGERFIPLGEAYPLQSGY